MAKCSCNWDSGVTTRADEVTRLLIMSQDYVDQTPGRDKINGLQHALRCAGQAAAHSWHMEAPFIALVHDLARPLNDVHHGEVIAEIVRDRVSTLAYDVLRTHGQYQSAYVHSEDYPQQDYDTQRVAMQLVGFEVNSFRNDYEGPTMRYSDAVSMLHTYLD